MALGVGKTKRLKLMANGRIGWPEEEEIEDVTREDRRRWMRGDRGLHEEWPRKWQKENVGDVEQWINIWRKVGTMEKYMLTLSLGPHSASISHIFAFSHFIVKI